MVRSYPRCPNKKALGRERRHNRRSLGRLVWTSALRRIHLSKILDTAGGPSRLIDERGSACKTLLRGVVYLVGCRRASLRRSTCGIVSENVKERTTCFPTGTGGNRAAFAGPPPSGAGESPGPPCYGSAHLTPARALSLSA